MKKRSKMFNVNLAFYTSAFILLFCMYDFISALKISLFLFTIWNVTNFISSVLIDFKKFRPFVKENLLLTSSFIINILVNLCVFDIKTNIYFFTLALIIVFIGLFTAKITNDK